MGGRLCGVFAGVFRVLNFLEGVLGRIIAFQASKSKVWLGGEVGCVVGLAWVMSGA